MNARKLFWTRLKNGSSRCCRCGHRFGKNEQKFFPYPPDMLLRSVCEECKKKESAGTNGSATA